MFRLMQFQNADIGKRDAAYEISLVASDTICRALSFLYGTSKAFEHNYKEYWERCFVGAGEFFHTDDAVLGREFLSRKVKNMHQKLRDEEAYHSFDVFEEFVFGVSIYIERKLIASGFAPEESLSNRNVNGRLASSLIKNYGYEKALAEEIEYNATHLWAMELKLEDEDNYYFSDSDHQAFFVSGFVEGMRTIVSYTGKILGYDYEYATSLLADVGLTPSPMLLGTREAYELKMELEEVACQEESEDLFGGSGQYLWNEN